MDYVIKNINACEKELVINATEKELQKFINQKYNELAPKVNLKGFRKGKAPKNVVMRYYGDQIKNDAENSLGNYFFRQVTTEQKITVAGTPFFKSIKPNEKGLELVIGFETPSDFDLGDYTNFTIKEPVHRVSDEEVDTQLDNILLANGTFKDAEKIDGINFKIKVKPQVENAKPEDKQSEPFDLLLTNQRLPKDLIDAFIGKKLHDMVEYKPEGATRSMFYTIDKVEEIIKLEPTVENIKKLSEEKFDNIEDFKKELGFQLQEMWDEKSRDLMDENIMDALIAKYNFEIPKEMYRENLVRYTINFYKQQKVNLKEKDVIDDLPMFEKYFGDTVMKLAKWAFISEKIIAKEKLEIEDSDYDEQIEKFRDQFPDVTSDNMKSLLKENPEFKETLLRKKLMDVLREYATTDEVDYDTFVKERNSMLEAERVAKYNSVQNDIKEETANVKSTDKPEEKPAEESK